MSLSEQIKEAVFQEQRLTKLVEEIQSHIAAEIDGKCNADGVTLVKTSFPCALVKFSALEKGTNLSPETYIGKAQANAVMEKIKSAKTVSSLQKKIQEMVETGTVVTGNTKVILNNKTINLLKDFIAV